MRKHFVTLYIFIVSTGVYSCSPAPIQEHLPAIQVSDSLPVFEKPPVENLNIPAPSEFYGIGFARHSNYDEPRSYAEAREYARVDLAANILTSVYLEYYGTNTQPTQLQAEFAITDTLPSSDTIVIDSTKVGDWAVYYIGSKNTISELPEQLTTKALSLNWTTDFFEPVNIDGYWVAAGWVPVNVYNPNRGWTLARQEALKNLSLHRSSVVQANERLYNEVYRSINYTTSKHVFNNIHPIGRKLINNNIYVLIAIHQDDLIRIDE
ncbi:MAG: hypothetical protein MI700_06400 [Balneolales bacterium]|nr:hypothetical protein [Balneolales bacterium]